MVEITKQLVIDFFKQYYSVMIVAAIFLIGFYFWRKSRNKPVVENKIIQSYKPEKRGRKPKVQEIIEDIPDTDMESELMRDMEKWKRFDENLAERRGEILNQNIKLKEELARIDAWRNFIKDVFKKTGREKDEN